MSKKKCHKCEVEKELNFFYKDKTKPMGVRTYCKQCDKKISASRREYFRVYSNKRYAEDESFRESKKKRQEKWRLENLEKANAHSILHQAVYSGKINKKPCFVCGCEKTEAHHEDYSKPLEVVWLCSPHHQQTHHS